MGANSSVFPFLSRISSCPLRRAASVPEGTEALSRGDSARQVVEVCLEQTGQRQRLLDRGLDRHPSTVDQKIDHVHAIGIAPMLESLGGPMSDHQRHNPNASPAVPPGCPPEGTRPEEQDLRLVP